MRKTTLLTLLALLLTGTIGAQTVIAGWDFENGTKRGAITSDASFQSAPYTADSGTDANRDVSFLKTVGRPVFSGWVSGSGGTGTWAPNTNGWTGGSNTHYWQISLSTSGFANLVLSSKQYGSTTGPRDFQLQYSLDESAWTAVSYGSVTVGSNWSSGYLNSVALPAACSDQPVLHLRWIMTSNTSVGGGSTGGTGTDRIDDISISGEVVVPTISLTPSSLSGFGYMVGLGPSAEQSFSVSALNIVNPLLLSAPQDFEISAVSGGSPAATLSLTPTGNTVPATTVYVRLKAGLGVGTYAAETVVASTPGAASQSVACSGTVAPAAVPAAPLAQDATGISPTGFSANWTAVANATGYRLDVFETAGATATDLFFSEYLEGSSFNKAIEIFNGTGVAADLGNYTVYLYSNGAASPSTTLALSGTLASGEVYVIASSQANAEILAQADLTSGVANFNGDDALALWNESTAAYVDVFGRIGEDPGDFWGSDPLLTKDRTLVRKSAVSGGVSANPSSGFPSLATEWDSHPVDTAAYLGSHAFYSQTETFVAGYQDLGVGDLTSWPVSGLAESTTYGYRVRAENPYGASLNSNRVDVTTSSSTAPLISVSGYPGSFATWLGTPSATQTYGLSGQFLTNPITLAIPAGFEISSDGGSSYQTGTASLPADFSGSVGIRLSGNASGTYTGNIVHSSAPAASVSLPVQGVVTDGNISAPTVQASGILCYPTSTTITLEWTPGNGAYRVVKINTVNSFTVPADGSSPSPSSGYSGSGEQVIYNGATEFIDGSQFNGCTVTNLIPNTLYWFRVYDYNGTGADTRYLAAAAANNPRSATTTSSSGTGYYGSIYGYGTTLKANLHALIKSTHTTQYSYTALISQIPYTDEDPANPNNLVEIYTGWSVPKGDFGGGVTDWNREHTWSKSHGDFGDTAPAGTDLHHLRPCDATVNSRKSNKDFGNGGSAYVDNSPPSGYSGDTGCFDTTNSWEPRPADKGDVARMIMYMAVRYEGTDTSYDLELVDYIYSDAGTYEPFYGKLATLLQWHLQDPPDARELQRNNRIAERQGNRNPFIDVPGYAARVWAPCPLFNSNIQTASFTGNWSVPITASNYFLQVAADSLFTLLVSGYENRDIDLATSLTVAGLNPGGTYYYRLRSYFLDDYGIWSPYLAVTLGNPVIATAALSSGQPLEEPTLHGAPLSLTLSNANFSDASLLSSNFSLNNAPLGIYIQSVSYVNSVTATILLGFNGTDFDANFTAFSVTVAGSELSVGYSVTSSTLPLIAHVEGQASIALEGGYIRLTLLPVPNAASYRIFAATEPYGAYSEISSAGAFDPFSPNIWRIDSALFDRRFYKVAAILN